MTAEGWTPIALGKDVPAGTTRGVILDGRELVIWRGADGEAHVWEDRCPHRGMRLSFGFVRENSLNCLYHGWQYGAGASCIKIPAHSDLTVPPTIRANAYASAETGAMIWVRLAGDATAPALPDTTPLATIAIDATPAAIFGTIPSPLMTLAESGLTFYFGWHQSSPAKTLLHATLDGPATPDALRVLRSLRARAEQGAAA